MEIQFQKIDQNWEGRLLSLWREALLEELPIARWPEKQVTECLTKEHVFAATLDDSLLGIVIFRRLDHELGEIDQVYISKDRRGQTLGQKLILSLLSAEPSARWILEVSEANKPALNLYKKLGFCLINRRESYYSDASAALVFEKINQ